MEFHIGKQLPLMSLICEVTDIVNNQSGIHRLNRDIALKFTFRGMEVKLYRKIWKQGMEWLGKFHSRCQENKYFKHFSLAGKMIMRRIRKWKKFAFFLHHCPVGPAQLVGQGAGWICQSITVLISSCFQI